jgi:Peptidase family M1 domain
MNYLTTKIMCLNYFKKTSGRIILLLMLQSITHTGFTQGGYWQQRVKYTMDIDMNVQTNRFTGRQQLDYTNHSPDTLRKVFYHLFWNAFQPNSMMDKRSASWGANVINGKQDWDPRVMDRIQHLKPDEIGYQKIISLKMNGVSQHFQVEETILEVNLTKPILPNTTVHFEMEFEAQVPLQVRRSGRDNPETKVRYSMSQWYPKICEYDFEGWHATPYLNGEFYGVWGDFDVSIHIDKSFILGGSGYLQNPQEIGYGYEAAGSKVNRPAGEKLTWHFYAPNVHDFVWAADPEYKHVSKKVRDNLTLHLLYKPTTSPEKNWLQILDVTEKALPFIEKTYGPYPYKQYSFILGGDGGMEYPMATLLNSANGNMHEFMHSWYQGMLGTNELEYPWMDEGFTQYAAARNWGYLNKDTSIEQTFKKEYDAYFSLARSRDVQEPLTTYADYFNSRMGYQLSSYYKGCVFMVQLGYIVGDPILDKILLEYYQQWRFKHPDPNDFFRVAEKVSGLQLNWYKDFWIKGIKKIDYGIDSLWEVNGKTRVRLRMIGQVPMPIDVLLQYSDSSRELAYIPLYSMFGAKPEENKGIPRTVYEPWKWTSSSYEFEVNHRLTDLRLIEIDASHRMADVNRNNNKLELKW